LHTVIYRFGLFASGGYKLFLLPLAPVIAISSVTGLEWIAEKLQGNILFADKSTEPKNQLTSAICIGCVLFAMINVKPHKLDKIDKAVKGATGWVRSNNIDTKHVITTHVFFYYFLPMEVPVNTLWVKFPPLSELPPGTVVIWDDKYSDMWDLKSEYFTDQPDTWEKIKTYGDDLVVIYRKLGRGIIHSHG
jgi:hypothetical protein